MGYPSQTANSLDARLLLFGPYGWAGDEHEGEVRSGQLGYIRARTADGRLRVELPNVDPNSLRRQIADGLNLPQILKADSAESARITLTFDLKDYWLRPATELSVAQNESLVRV